MLAIETDRLTRQFGEGESRRTAVDGLTLEIQPGEVFGMLGPNGAGKTTTFRLLNGLMTPSSGKASVLGMDPVLDGAKIRARTGVLTESPSLYEQLTAYENLSTFATLYGVPKAEIQSRVMAVLDMFGLQDRANEKVAGYSKGMKQRVALARALVHDPQILFLDEPTSTLDPESARQVNDLIEMLSRERGRTILLATHDLNDAQRLCDRVAVLNQGKVLALGTSAELAKMLWSTVWIDITLRVTLPSPTLEKITQVPGVCGIEQSDLVLGVQVLGKDTVPSLITAVVNAGAQVMQVKAREYSLGDVYFALQKRQVSHP